MKGRPNCFGKFEGKYSEKPCLDCGDKERCYEETLTSTTKNTGGKKDNKPLDPAWVEHLIDAIIGPSLIILGMNDNPAAVKLRGLLSDAVKDKYSGRDWVSTEEWVEEASRLVLHLYSIYMTAQLRHYFDNGAPTKSKILIPSIRLNN